MARIDYATSVSVIQSTTLEGNTVEAIDAEIGRSLGGGNSSLTWAGSDIDAWAGGVMTHIEASTTPVAVAANGDDGVWIKHTGLEYISAAPHLGTVANNDAVTIKLASTNLCTLNSGVCIFIPKPLGTINVVGADDTGPAIEYAKLT